MGKKSTVPGRSSCVGSARFLFGFNRLDPKPAGEVSCYFPRIVENAPADFVESKVSAGLPFKERSFAGARWPFLKYLIDAGLSAYEPISCMLA